MNNLMEENQSALRQSEKFVTPAASVTEGGDGYTLQLEMPGVNKESLDISVEDNELTIVGRRTVTIPEGVLVHRESRTENYRRIFELDPSVDVAPIVARMDQGIATLDLPKAEHVKPRKIAVA
jgi:HSP20 family protein